MTSINLEDVEEYLVKQAKERHWEGRLPDWLHGRFAELRVREAAVLRGQ